MLAVMRQCQWLWRDGLPHRIFWLSRGSACGSGAMGSRAEYFGCLEAVPVATARWAPARNIGVFYDHNATTAQPYNQTTTQPNKHTTTQPHATHNHTTTPPHDHTPIFPIHTHPHATHIHNHLTTFPSHTHTHTTIFPPTRRSLSVVVHAYPQVSIAAFRFRRFTVGKRAR